MFGWRERGFGEGKGGDREYSLMPVPEGDCSTSGAGGQESMRRVSTWLGEVTFPASQGK